MGRERQGLCSPLEPPEAQNTGQTCPEEKGNESPEPGDERAGGNGLAEPAEPESGPPLGFSQLDQCFWLMGPRMVLCLQGRGGGTLEACVALPHRLKGGGRMD